MSAANEPGWDELEAREAEEESAEMQAEDKFWADFDVLLAQADETMLFLAIGRIKNHARRIVAEHDRESRRIEALRKLVTDVIGDENPTRARTRAKRSDAGTKRSAKSTEAPPPQSLRTVETIDVDPFDPVYVETP